MKDFQTTLKALASSGALIATLSLGCNSVDDTTLDGPARLQTTTNAAPASNVAVRDIGVPKRNKIKLIGASEKSPILGPKRD